jgi:hypothetical protein
MSDAVKRVVAETFYARDIAEPLASFDASILSKTVRDFVVAHDFDVVGIRREGRIVGYTERDSLDGDACGHAYRLFDAETVLDGSTPLLAVPDYADRNANGRTDRSAFP